MPSKHRWVLGSLCVLVCVTVPFLGTYTIAPWDLISDGSGLSTLFFDLRLPRWLLVLTVGASLAVLGALYQSILQNPLAEPYILGVSSAVILGIVVSEIFLGSAPGSLGAQLSGLVGAVLLSMALLLMAVRQSHALERLILFGMGVNFLLSSLVFLLLSYHSQQLGGGTLRWLFGRIPWWGWEKVLWLALPCLSMIGVSLLTARWVDALSFGDSQARSLGISPTRVRGFLLLLTSCWLGLIVSATGAIGFAGLVVPHACRYLLSPQTARSLIVYSAVGGGTFLALSDTLSRLIYPPMEFPIGILTTLLGGPAFLWLLWRVR